MGFMLVSGCTSLLRRTWNARDSPVKVSLCNLLCLFPSGTGVCPCCLFPSGTGVCPCCLFPSGTGVCPCCLFPSGTGVCPCCLFPSGTGVCPCCLFPSGTVSTGEEISFSFNVLSLTTLLLYEVRLNKLFLPRILISWEIRVVKQ